MNAKQESTEKETTLGLTVRKSEDFSEWYTQVVQKAELADYTSVSGCIVFRPLAYAIWEKISAFVDSEIKKLGHQNVYFPLFIPEALLKKEEEHVEGFSPEVAWVTCAGDTELSERLAVRPTSETIMYENYAKWIRSHRDLPLLLNQWCNVVRWEFKYPRPFLRTREFLWQEGHTAHATEDEADREVMDIINVYTELIESHLAIPILRGRKTDKEKFAGALYTVTMEALMPDGKAIQMGTAHNLGQNFSKAFDISFTDADEKRKYVWQTSWAVTTRLIGTIIMVHGDDKGLVLPPRIAPTKAVIVPIIFEKSKKEVIAKAKELREKLSSSDTLLDDQEEYSAGWKFNNYELKGVPVRIELGPKDLEKNQCVFVRRDTGKKEFVGIENAPERLRETLDEMQKAMYDNAKRFLDENTVDAFEWNDFVNVIESRKMARSFWCGSLECEDWIKDKTGGATSRCIPLNDRVPEGMKCVYCQKPAKHTLYFSKAY